MGSYDIARNVSECVKACFRIIKLHSNVMILNVCVCGYCTCIVCPVLVDSPLQLHGGCACDDPGLVSEEQIDR
jgi:hypothetical protein